MARPTDSKLRGRATRTMRRLANVARRVVLDRLGTDVWTMLGFVDGDAKELFKVEPFPGVGFDARPKSGARIEGIILSVGGSENNRVMVATRDKDLMRSLSIDDDETVMFNDSVMVKLTASGEVHCCTHDGSPVALALKSDVQQIKTAITNAVPLANDGGAQLQAQILAELADYPVGTTKLKGE